MARFYSALATDGSEPTPMIKRGHRSARVVSGSTRRRLRGCAKR
jgi:hypothetical protein